MGIYPNDSKDIQSQVCMLLEGSGTGRLGLLGIKTDTYPSSLLFPFYWVSIFLEPWLCLRKAHQMGHQWKPCTPTLQDAFRTVVGSSSLLFSFYIWLNVNNKSVLCLLLSVRLEPTYLERPGASTQRNSHLARYLEELEKIIVEVSRDKKKDPKRQSALL